MILCLVAIAFTLTLLSCDNCTAERFYNDTSLSGTYENTTIESWGNITVPRNSTLELINVTLMFHTEGGQRSLLGLKGCAIRIADTDGNPDTLGDASIITASPDPWSIDVLDGSSFSVLNSRLDGIDGYYRRPDGSLRIPNYDWNRGW